MTRNFCGRLSKHETKEQHGTEGVTSVDAGADVGADASFDRASVVTSASRHNCMSPSMRSHSAFTNFTNFSFNHERRPLSTQTFSTQPLTIDTSHQAHQALQDDYSARFEPPESSGLWDSLMNCFSGLGLVDNREVFDPRPRSETISPTESAMRVTVQVTTTVSGNEVLTSPADSVRTYDTVGAVSTGNEVNPVEVNYPVSTVETSNGEMPLGQVDRHSDVGTATAAVGRGRPNERRASTQDALEGASNTPNTDRGEYGWQGAFALGTWC